MALYLGSNKIAGSKSIERAVNSLYLSNNNTNPSTIFGGTWELIDKQFSSWTKQWTQDSTDSPFTPSENTSAYTFNIVRSGHEIRIRLEITTAVEIADDVITFGTIDWTKLGVTDLTYSILQVPCGYDSAGGIVNVAIGWTGSIESRDIVSKSGASSLSAGGLFVITAPIVMAVSDMIDEHCNQFIWKKVSEYEVQ